jgi:hypothetical protein
VPRLTGALALHFVGDHVSAKDQREVVGIHGIGRRIATDFIDQRGELILATECAFSLALTTD